MTLGAFAGAYARTKIQLDEQKRAEEAQRKHILVSVLADALNDPNRKQDQKIELWRQIGENIGEKSGKKGGFIDFFSNIFHGGRQQEQAQNPLASLIASAQADNNRPVSQGVSSVPTRIGVQMPAVPETSEGGTATVESPGFIFNKPTRYGEQTNQQLTDRRALDLFGQQQSIRAKYDAENDERTRQLRLEQARIMGENAFRLAQTNNSARQTRLDDQQLFQLSKERDALYQSYLGTMGDPVAAMAKANEEYQRKYESVANELEASARLKNVTADFIPVKAELQKRGLELREYKTDADIDIAQQRLALGLSAQQQKQLDSETKPLWDQLRAIRNAREQIVKASVSNVYSMAQPELARDAIKDMDTRADDIQKQIDAARGRYPSATTTVPQRQQRDRGHGSRYVAPRVSKQQLDDLLN